MRIMGVDFSGAGSDNAVGKTWLAQGQLDGNILNLEALENPRRISRTALTNELAGLTEPAVVGMDFPFSVPVEFANHWQPNAQAMPDLWRAAAAMDLAGFTNMRDGFVGIRGMEPIRPCDPPESISPLNIRMRPMTLAGMQMLHRLRKKSEAGKTNKPVRVLPLHPNPDRDSLILLEVMPGATLSSLGLPHTGYKDTQRQRDQRREMREYILGQLPQRTNPLTPNLPGEAYEVCLNNDDALDAVIAAITAALWSIGVPAQREPAGCPDAELVGWMYVPQQANQ